MRTPRSNFVVEYKTNRRQTQARPTSIWGNLDLQAVTREVEANAAVQEVDLPQVHQVLEHVDPIELEAVASDAQVAADSPSGAPPTTYSPNETIKPVAVEDNAFNAAQELPNPAPGRAPRHGAKPRTKRQPSDLPERHAVLDHRRDPSVLYGSEEELAVLEAENRYLKHLTIVKLREENDRLNSMLRRFGTSRQV